ncbi:MAG TPA: DinB family protein [Terriglobia bacterium]|nr:DinB family protein [Terriglobia bacterium]
MPANSLDSKLLLQVIDSGYVRKAWHGPNLKQSLRGVAARDAAWRPAPGRHNIWEIAVHAAYWKYVVRRKLTGEPRGSFALKGSNWFKRPLASTEKAWQEDRKLLEGEHLKLREAVAALGPAQARQIPWSILYGVAFHDVYHAGQIRLLRRLRTRA